MKKPKKETKTAYDYFEVIKYIEKKYNINTNDYYNSLNQFNLWRTTIVYEPEYNFDASGPKKNPWRIWNDNGDKTSCTEIKYKIQIAKCHEQFRRYKKWEKKNHVPYCNFWNWLNDNFWNSDNYSYQTLWFDEVMSNLKETDWQYKILKLIYDEFKENQIDFFIEW